MIGAYKTTSTYGAGEFLLAGMHSAMARKLIRSSESFFTALHWAGIRSFSSMNSDVGLEMG